MAQLIQLDSRCSTSTTSSASTPPHPPKLSSSVLWLQSITVVWMLIECGVSGYAAWTARSPAILAFGADSVVEVLSASVVLMQFAPGSVSSRRIAISERSAARVCAVLLFLAAVVVAAIAVASLAMGMRPEVSRPGIAITIAALVAMPVLARLKRREARRSGNSALAADAVQSATCAYLAAIALAGLACHAAFRFAPIGSWIDPAAALAAVPLLVREGRSAWRGNPCGCC